MILAAGRGARLRPLTDKIPKPLVRVGKQTLIEHHIFKLANAGFESIIINTAHLGGKIRDYLGSGDQYGIPIEYSDEGDEALETAGGISYALPLLGNKPFLIISSDIYCDIPFNANFQLNESRMHMIMVNNPKHHPAGDFKPEDIHLDNSKEERVTYSGIAYVDPSLFVHEKRKFPLLDSIKRCIKEKTISAELHNGIWFDVGTASRLHAANRFILQNQQ